MKGAEAEQMIALNKTWIIPDSSLGRVEIGKNSHLRDIFENLLHDIKIQITEDLTC